MTDGLIARLAGDLKPVRSKAVEMWLAVATVAGLVVSGVIVAVGFGLRPDFSAASATFGFWAKFGYTLVLGVLGVWAAQRVARPGGTARRPLALVPVVVAVLALSAVGEYLLAPRGERQALVWGSSALVCPFYILGLSVPLLVAAFAFLRRMAPTDLSRAGLAGGLMAGALGAWAYSFHCTEQGIPFLALWYSLGIFGMAAFGYAAGRWALRW